MRKFLAAILMFVLLLAPALAPAASASAAAMPDGVSASVASGATDAPLRKRVCWRKTLTSAPADTQSLPSPSCFSVAKNVSAAPTLAPPAVRHACPVRGVLALAGSDRSALFRPPIA